MLSQNNLKQIELKGLTESIVEKQLKQIKEGFPFLKLKAAASVTNGIITPNEEERAHYINVWNAYKSQGKNIVKFVPASGAASRMFKNLFEFLDASYNEPTTDFEKTFCNNIKKFAFREELCSACKKKRRQKHKNSNYRKRL